VGLIVVLSYGFVEISEFRKKKMQETGKVEKTLNVRKKDFYNSPEEKEKILNPGNEITVIIRRKQISQVYLYKFLKQTKNLRKQMKHSRK